MLAVIHTRQHTHTTVAILPNETPCTYGSQLPWLHGGASAGLLCDDGTG